MSWIVSAVVALSVALGLLGGPAAASGDPALDRYIVVPVPGLPQVPIPASTLSDIAKSENQDLSAYGTHTTVAGRLYRASARQTAEVLLARVSGVSDINQAAGGVVPYLVGQTCQAAAGHSVIPVAVPSVPTALLVSCGRIPNGSTLAQIGFREGQRAGGRPHDGYHQGHVDPSSPEAVQGFAVGAKLN